MLGFTTELTKQADHGIQHDADRKQLEPVPQDLEERLITHQCLSLGQNNHEDKRGQGEAEKRGDSSRDSSPLQADGKTQLTGRRPR